MYIVELESGVYLAPWKGDPGRTLVKESAKVFSSWRAAKRAVMGALQYRKFENIMVIPVSNAQQANYAMSKPTA